MTIDPQKLATRRRELSQEYKKDMEELGDIIKKKAFKLIELRAIEEVKSDKQAERLWAVTEDGQREITLLFKTRGLLELMRAVKSEIDIMQAEAYNQY